MHRLDAAPASGRGDDFQARNSVPTIAEWLGVHEGAVYWWFDRIEREPPEAAVSARVLPDCRQTSAAATGSRSSPPSSTRHGPNAASERRSVDLAREDLGVASRVS